MPLLHAAQSAPTAAHALTKQHTCQPTVLAMYQPFLLWYCSAPGAELLQKLYKHKLESLLKQQATTLVRCSSCGQLYPVHSHSRLQCPTMAGACTTR